LIGEAMDLKAIAIKDNSSFKKYPRKRGEGER
jgi:hypothetical protein